MNKPTDDIVKISNEILEKAESNSVSDSDVAKMLNLILLVLLDVRETMYLIEKDRSLKWGSKL